VDGLDALAVDLPVEQAAAAAAAAAESSVRGSLVC